MKDYSDLNLTPNLVSQDSLAVRTDSGKQNIVNLVSDIVQNLNPNISSKTVLDGIMFKHVGTTPFEAFYAAGLMTSNSSLTSSTFGAGTLRAMPFLSTRGGVIDRIMCRVVTGTPSAEFRMGIYQSTSQTNLYPNNLILDAGTFDASVSGTTRIGTIDVALQSNLLYWFVYVNGGTANPNIRDVDSDDAFNMLGVGTDFVSAYNSIGVDLTYGTLPATFPTGGTLAALDRPMIAVRFSK